MNYQEAWDFLDALQFFKIKLGLDSMATFLGRLGSPQEGLRYIHVAGTNGKGSVAATLRAILTAAGLRVGVYTSPHLSSVRERFRVNDDFISQEAFARHASRIVEVLAGDQITYFEFTTTLALLWFAEEKVDYVILEVGMGGRLDATNVVVPELSVITNVAMDHEAYLGETLAAIAFEKAGIIKPGVAVLSGVEETLAAEVVQRTAAACRAPLYRLGTDFTMTAEGEAGWRYTGLGGRTYGGLRLALRGRHQAANTALALAALEVLGQERALDEQVLRQGLLTASWPGRLEYLPGLAWRGKPPRAVLLDGAHNPAGVETLVAALGADFRYNRLIMVWASMGDKDFSACVRAVGRLCHCLIFTRPETLRSATPAALSAVLPPELRDRGVAAPEVEEALGLAYDLAAEGDLICIAGSLYLVGKARALLVGDLIDD